MPDSLRLARVAFTEWLAQLQWPADDADDLILAVNEAVANVIDHAYPAADPGPVGLHAWTGAGSTPTTQRATITVTDHGDWGLEHRTIDPAGRRGHGLAVMSACTANMHIQRSAGGTTVTLVSNDAPTTRSAATFPEIAAAVIEQLPPGVVVNGAIWGQKQPV